MKSTIKLFKAVPLKEKIHATKINYNSEGIKSVMESTVKRGYIFSNEILATYSNAELNKLIREVRSVFGATGKEMNASFHKSWAKIRDAPIEQLVMEQIIHYITTYGFEACGCYSEESVYIPDEALEIPDMTLDGLKLIIIKGLTKEEIKEKLMKLLTSGIALKTETIKDCLDICNYTGLSSDEVHSIKNKEIKIELYERYNIVPKNPVEFLRYVLYKTTGKTLMIKNDATITEIKNSDYTPNELFVNYGKTNGFKNLAKIFNRYKPIFLAFKGHNQLNAIINNVSRLSKKYHEPMPRDYLNNVTAMMCAGAEIDKAKLVSELNKVNIFRKIRLAYALKFRTTNPESVMYKVRNGKAYAKEYEFTNDQLAQDILNIVLKSMVKDINKKVDGKKIFMPHYINYALPSTEKQFSGNFPAGTSITTDKDMIFGVHWTNVSGHRVDLDLSLLNANGKIGWDACYRDGEDILFSGDITDAPKPKGASELFYVKKQSNGSHLMMCNYYNHTEDVPVPIKIMVGRETLGDLKQNHMINPNNVITSLPSTIVDKQTALGLIITTPEQCKFIFTESSIGRSITSANTPQAKHAKDFLTNYYDNMISLNDVLEQTSAVFVDDVNECDINLSPEALEKDTIINLLQ